MGSILWRETIRFLLFGQWSHSIGRAWDGRIVENNESKKKQEVIEQWQYETITCTYQIWLNSYHIFRRLASLKISESLVVSELWPWILLTKVMETIQVEGFQTCYQMYRNLTDKATWIAENQEILESKQHQNMTMFWKSFLQHVHHLHHHFLHCNILNCIIHFPLFQHRLRSPIWTPIGITCIVQKRSISQMQSCSGQRQKTSSLKAIGPARAWKMDGGSLTLWPRLEFYVADGVFLNRPTGFFANGRWDEQKTLAEETDEIIWNSRNQEAFGDVWSRLFFQINVIDGDDGTLSIFIIFTPTVSRYL